MANTDLTKVVFNPTKSLTFTPVKKAQQVILEITNNSTSGVLIKFKNTNPSVFKTNPCSKTLAIGEKHPFKCIFKGGTKEDLRGKLDNQRYTVVMIAASANANKEKVNATAFKTATLKHKIAILFMGINDQKEKETQQATNNNDEDEEKDRLGKMRSKSKIDAEKGNKPIVMMFTRKGFDSLSDEDDDEDGKTVPVGGPTDDMMTTRPAGNFTGQVAPTDNQGSTTPKSELRTTRPAGTFTGQVASNAVGTPVDSKSNGLRTTRPAGAFNGQVTPNAGGSDNQDMKTTKPAGTYENPQKNNNK